MHINQSANIGGAAPEELICKNRIDGRFCGMNKFLEWLIASILFAFIGLVVVLNVESWARLSGELNRNIILTGTASTFALVIISFLCLFEANSERKNQ